MNKNSPLIRATILVAVLIAAFLLTLTATAALPAAIPPPEGIAEAAPPTTDMLIAFPVAPLEPANIPADLTPEQAQIYARDLTYRQAGPFLAELERLRAEGIVGDFSVQPDSHGIAVQLRTPGSLDKLSRLTEVAAVLPLKADAPPACATAAAKALPDQVLGMSRAVKSAEDVQVARVVPQATDPSITAYVQPGAMDDTWWSSVSGQTTPNTAVTMRLLRRGRVVGTGSTTSFSSGYYYIYPSWQQCPTYGYNWSLRPGDVVEVTAHGNTVTTVVANLSAWVDPVADTVTGKTDPGRTAQVTVYDYDGGACNSTGYTKSVSPDGSGNFTVNFTGTADFDRRAYAYVYAQDAKGNSTYYGFNAYQIAAYFNRNIFWGYLKPGVDFTATLRRLGEIVSTASGKSSVGNYYSGSFYSTFYSPVPLQPGDVIEVNGGGVTVQYTTTDLNATLNPVTDQATGATGANRPIQGVFYTRDWGYVTTACSYNYRCASTVANGAGAFTLPAGMDLARGDRSYFYVYDAEGNYQTNYGYLSLPAIVARPSWNSIAGYWSKPGVYLTVTLKDSGGSVKNVVSWVWADSYYGEFYTYPGTISPGDIIEVTDGVITETMTVQNLTARLDDDTGHLTGTAASGHLLARLWDFRRESGGSQSYCQETTVASPYDLTFSDAQVGGQDSAEVWSTGPDGHYTHRYPHAFTVNVAKGEGYIWGYSETPSVTINATLKRGGNLVGATTVTSSADGYFDATLGNNVTVTQGDTLETLTGDGDSVSLVIPELTINADGIANRLYGKSPASQPVSPETRRVIKYGWYGQRMNTIADSIGNYSSSFNGLYWTQNCSAVTVAHQCAQSAVYYYNPAGHRISSEGPYPAAVEPDAYENDDSSATARAYTGVQSHTFHATGENDWVSFTVPTTDVTKNVVYHIETINLGLGMDTYLYLYDTDGFTALRGDDDSGPGLASLITWIPEAEGTYYVRVLPYSDSSTAYCDAVYDLRILPVRGQIFLPLVLRE